MIRFGQIFNMGWLLTVSLLLSVVVNGQSIRYSNFYDANDGGAALDQTVVLDDGSLLIAGKTSNSFGTEAAAFNLLVDEDGTILNYNVWEEEDKSIEPYAIVRAESGSIYEAGTLHDYSEPSLGTGDFFMAKLDVNADTLFTVVFERPDTSDFMLDIVQTKPNKLLLIGWTYNDTVAVSASAQLLFITCDTMGNKLNEVVWGGSYSDYIHSGITINEQGEVLMTGFTRSFGGGSQGRSWVIKTDSVGNVLWHKEYLSEWGANGSSGQRLGILNDGNYLVVGGNLTFGGTTNGVDAGMLKIDSNGNQIWAREYPIIEGQGLWDVKQLEDGNIVSCGVTTYTDDNSQAGWLVKTDSEGNMLWTRTFNPSNLVDFIRFMVVMDNGDIVMLGNGRAPGETIQDGWVLRVDSEGCLVEGCSVGIDEESNTETGLTVYPNPATTEFSLEFSGIKFNEAEVVIRNLIGKEVLRFRPNRSRQTIDVSTWARGIYHCSVYGNQQLLQTEKVVLVK